MIAFLNYYAVAALRSIFAAWSILSALRNRTVPHILIAVGGAIVATVSVLNTFYGPQRTLNADGDVVGLSAPLLPWPASLYISTLGLLTLLLGVAALMRRCSRSGPSNQPLHPTPSAAEPPRRG